jgi:hypothetical protein
MSLRATDTPTLIKVMEIAAPVIGFLLCSVIIMAAMFIKYL